MPVTTKIGQSQHMGKWDATVAMLRLVRDLQEMVEDLSDEDKIKIDNVYYTFLATLPAKVKEEVRHG